MGNGKLHSIQMMRAIAALLVVVAHIIEHPLSYLPGLVLFPGRLGVDIFFVISGIIISQVAGDRPFSPGSFLLRRFFRVAPIYWICTLVVAWTAIAFPAVFKTTVFTAERLWYSLAFIPSPDPIDPDDWRPLFKIGWTLVYEMFFYTAVTALFWCHSSRQRAIGLTLIIGPLLLAGLFMKSHSSLIGQYTSLDLLPFLLGVWISEYFRRSSQVNLRPLPLAAIALVLLAPICYFYYIDPAGRGAIGLQLMVVSFSGTAVLLGLSYERRIDWQRWHFIEVIGDSSYSLYLLHMFVVGLAVVVLRKLSVTGPLFWFGMSFALPLSLVLSYLSFRFLELPINYFGKRLDTYLHAARRTLMATKSG